MKSRWFFGELLVSLWLLAATVAPAGCDRREATSAVGRTPSSTAPAKISESRLQQLQQALRSKDWRIRRRAVQELQPLVNTNPSVLKAILDLLYRPEGDPTLDLALVALGTAKGDAAGTIVRAYREGSPEKRRELRGVLARMGKEAQGATSILRQELSDQRSDPATRAQILTVLACIGQASKEEMARIADIVSANETGTNEVLAVMMCSGRNEWVDEKLKKALIQALKSSDENSFLAPDALPTLGQKVDREVRDALAKAFDAAVKEFRKNPDEASQRLIDVRLIDVGLAIARVDQARRKATLRRVMKISRGQWHPRLCANYWTCGTETDESFIRDVLSFLDARDEEVLADAVKLAGAFGPRVRHVRPKLLRLAERSKSDEVREAAIEALGLIGDSSDADELQRLKQKWERGGRDVPTTQGALDDAINIIRMRN